MRYFLHDTNSFNDEKVSELYDRFGYEGIGLFYTILEKLAYQEKPIRTSVLKRQLFVSKKLEKIWSFLEETEMISSKDGETFNENILDYAGKYKIKNAKNAERVSQWREKKNSNNSVTHYESVTLHVRNADKVNKESKVKKEKKEIVLEGRDLIWDKWFKYKRERKQSYTEIGKKALVHKYEDESDETLEAIIEQSITNNWSGLFPLKEPVKPKTFSNPFKKDDKPYAIVVPDDF